MKLIAVKFCVVKPDGSITTWADVAKPIEQIIEEQFENKMWKGSKFDWIYLLFEYNDKHEKIYIDHKKYNKYLK